MWPNARGREIPGPFFPTHFSISRVNFMSRTGRPPKPTALKLVARNPGKRPLPKNEPMPRIESPPRPKHLSGEAAMEWDRLAPALVRLRLLSRLDRAAFAAYCAAWGRHVEAEEQIAKASAVTSSRLGSSVVNPWATISRQAADQMCKFLSEFGLSPAARARLALPSVPEGEEAPGGFKF
jgi:P27 family predicted phage terminase small subunit